MWVFVLYSVFVHPRVDVFPTEGEISYPYGCCCFLIVCEVKGIFFVDRQKKKRDRETERDICREEGERVLLWALKRTEWKVEQRSQPKKKKKKKSLFVESYLRVLWCT